jgi:hypothetical protein
VDRGLPLGDGRERADGAAEEGWKLAWEQGTGGERGGGGHTTAQSRGGDEDGGAVLNAKVEGPWPGSGLCRLCGLR